MQVSNSIRASLRLIVIFTYINIDIDIKLTNSTQRKPPSI